MIPNELDIFRPIGGIRMTPNEKNAATEPPWSVAQQRLSDGQIALYFEYKGHTVGRFSGSRENADWMVLCINAAHACYLPMADGVAQEGGFDDNAALWSAVLDRESK